MRIYVLIAAIVLAIAIPWLFAAYNITTPAIGLPYGYTIQVLNSDFELACPDHTFRTFRLIGVYVGLMALTLARLIVVNRRRKRLTRGFEIQPPPEP